MKPVSLVNLPELACWIETLRLSCVLKELSVKEGLVLPPTVQTWAYNGSTQVFDGRRMAWDLLPAQMALSEMGC